MVKKKKKNLYMHVSKLNEIKIGKQQNIPNPWSCSNSHAKESINALLSL